MRRERLEEQSYFIRLEEKIYEKYGKETTLITESKDYKLIGLPFYNSELNHNFEEVFSNKVLRQIKE